MQRNSNSIRAVASKMGMITALGAGVGTAVGAAIGNLPLGAAIGAAFGVIGGALAEIMRRKSRTE